MNLTHAKKKSALSVRIFSRSQKKKERIGVERFYFTVIVLTSTYKEDFEPKKFLEENVLLVVSFAEF